jgi:predicted transposase YdaD
LSLDDSSRYEGYVDGHIAGRAEGRAEGRADAMREMARALKSIGKMTIEEISIATGLAPDEISKL